MERWCASVLKNSMPATSPLPSLQELQEVFSLTESHPSGLMWKTNPSKQGGQKAGTPAGSKTEKGYWRVKYKQKVYLCHRIRWSLLNGRLVEPHENIDHATIDKDDNRTELRLATKSQNQYNRTRRNATSGYRRVVFTKNNPTKPWRVLFKVNGQNKYFGYFADAKEAAVYADQKALEHLDPKFIRLNF